MYVTDRQTDVRQKHRLMPPTIRGGGIIITKHTLHVSDAVTYIQKYRTVNTVYIEYKSVIVTES